MVNVMLWMSRQSYVRNYLYLQSNNEVPSLDSRNNRVSALSVMLHKTNIQREDSQTNGYRVTH